MTLELTYGYAVMPGLNLQPDLQYIINPGGNSAIPNALAIGVNVVAQLLSVPPPDDRLNASTGCKVTEGSPR